MKSYPSIPGPSKAPHEPCIAFVKYDGTLPEKIRIKPNVQHLGDGLFSLGFPTGQILEIDTDD